METQQRDSGWIEVTWLQWPLHINVISIINNLGEKHIQLSVHWSPLAWESANSHGVASCEYHLTVVLPCVGAFSCSLPQKRWGWLLCSIKRVEAADVLCKVSGRPLSPPFVFVAVLGLRNPDFWSRDLAVTASDDRGSGEIAPRTPKEAHISGLFNTQKHWSVGLWWSHCSENPIVQLP